MAERAAAGFEPRAWLLDHALPLWWRVGADHARGGWHDRVALDGTPVVGNQRARVQARQAFVYAAAGRIGWTGDWAAAVRHGIERLLLAFRRDDGLYRKAVSADGAPVDDGVDLYDQAFVLFALAAGYRALGTAAWRDAALSLLVALRRILAHPDAGFEEAAPRRLPLRANPHMHLLEALLAWVEAGAGDPFAAEARAVAALAERALIDRRTGAIGEYYDGDWRFAAGLDGGLREPGHQFEWSYLLGQADRLIGGDRAAAAARLYAFGTRGIDAARGVAVFALDDGGAVIDAAARLWAQTEWLRAAHVRGDAAGVRAALAATARFLDVPVSGLWHDRMDAEGRFVEEAAPASSFYHLVTGLLPLLGH